MAVSIKCRDPHRMTEDTNSWVRTCAQHILTSAWEVEQARGSADGAHLLRSRMALLC